MAHSTLSCSFLCLKIVEGKGCSLCSQLLHAKKKFREIATTCIILLKYGGKVAVATLSSYWPSFGPLQIFLSSCKKRGYCTMNIIPVLYVSIKTVVGLLINFFHSDQ
jgi:hypothetical protein